MIEYLVFAVCVVGLINCWFWYQDIKRIKELEAENRQLKKDNEFFEERVIDLEYELLQSNNLNEYLEEKLDETI